VAEAFPEAEIVRGDNGTILGLRLAGYDILAGLEGVDLDQEMAERLRYGEIEGVRVPIIPVEDNIALKTVWGRGTAEGKRDWEDIEGMMRAVETLDWGYLRSRLEQLESRERAQELLSKLETLGARIGTRSDGGVQIT
jgi:predicted nucleotidyltransferase